VVPKGPGKFAAILWGHWLMLNSSTSSREEFLNEAIALAPWGVVSLLRIMFYNSHIQLVT
jgi:hypothetical protein